MQDLLRRHKKAILVFILVFIGIPFVFFFGTPSTCDRRDRGLFQDETIGTVGGVPLRVSEFRRFLDTMAARQAQAGERPTYRDLDETGAADRILQQMVDAALISLQEKPRKFKVAQSLLEEEMRKWPMFQTEDGKFDAAAWNEWVRQNPRQDWNSLYESIRQGLDRKVFLGMVTAPAGRVLDSEIEQQLLDDHTKIQIKYVKIEPPVTLGDEDIQKQYDEHLEQYRTPDAYVAEFVAISLDPPMPEKALDIVRQAREGADFAALANEHSDFKSDNGGDMGWVSEGPQQMDFRQPLFTLKPGEVSDPVPGFNSYFIYKVEEERSNPDTQQREVRARQIMLRAQLSDEERAARDDIAAQMLEKARENTDFAAAAAAFDLEVKKTGVFTKETEEIENVPNADVRQFRTIFEALEEGVEVTSLTARRNIYVARLVEKTPGTIPPLDEIRDKVYEDAVAAHKKTEAYQARVREYAEKIKEQTSSLAEIAERFPELNVEIKETGEFTRKEYLFRDQLYLQTTQIYEAVGRGEPGTMGGPLKDFQNQTFFVELVKRTPPTEEDKQNWAEERKQRRESMMTAAENELLEDYLADLRERSLAQVPIRLNQNVIDRILGRDQIQKGEEETGTPLPPRVTSDAGILEGLRGD